MSACEETSPEQSNRQAQSAGQFYAASLGQYEGIDSAFTGDNDSEQAGRQRSRIEEYAAPSPWEGTAQKEANEAERTDESIGYKLLRKAGYKGRGGLGAREQGATQPLQAWRQPGKQGIGAADQTRAGGRRRQGAGPNPLPDPEQLGKEDAQKLKRDSAARKKEREMRRKWPSVRVEEDVDTKVKRWKQVMQAEADESAGKELSRYIFRLFRDEHALDSNPLQRRNNLSSSNPLL